MKACPGGYNMYMLNSEVLHPTVKDIHIVALGMLKHKCTADCTGRQGKVESQLAHLEGFVEDVEANDPDPYSVSTLMHHMFTHLDMDVPHIQHTQQTLTHEDEEMIEAVFTFPHSNTDKQLPLELMDLARYICEKQQE